MKYKNLNAVLGFFLILSSTYIASTRTIFLTYSDDLFRYYEAYQSVPYVSFEEYIFWDNREPLFQLYNQVIFLVFGEISPELFLQLIIMPGFIAYFCCLNKLSNKIPFGWLVYLSLLLPPILIYNTQLIRQAIAFYLLFLSILSSRTSSKFIFLALAVGFHYVTIPVAITYLSLRKFVVDRDVRFRFISIFVLLFLLISLPYIFNNLLMIFSKLPFLSEKIVFLSGEGVKISINHIGLFCFLVTFIYLVLCFSKVDELNKMYGIVLTLFLLASLGLYFEPVAQRFVVFLFSFLIPCGIEILRRYLNGSFSVLIILAVVTIYLIITIKYLTEPSYFVLFNGFFVDGV